MWKQHFKTVEIFLFASLLCFHSVAALSCLPCEVKSCEEPKCPGSLVLDPCRCCNVCAKQEGEFCAGLFNLAGQCDVGLTCVIEPDNGDYVGPEETNLGICQVQTDEDCTKALFFGCNLVDGKCKCGQDFVCSNPYEFNSQHLCYIEEQRAESSDETDCSDVHCAVAPSPLCPKDSHLVEGEVPSGECCPTPSYCKCPPSACDSFCPFNTRKVIIRKGSGKPGSCCDEYECLGDDDILDDECAAVRCAFIPLDWITCPPDSKAVRNPSPPNKCCPGDPICQCRNNCDYLKCPHGVVRQVLYKSNGNPGSCCDDVICSNDPIEVGCNINGTRHEHGDTYYRGCQICRCMMGVSHCETQSCPQLPCKQVTLADGGCCAVCVEENSAPIIEDRIPILEPICWNEERTMTYLVGQNWTSGDACTFCSCEEGGIRRCKAAFCGEPTLISATFPCPSLTDCPLDGFTCPDGLDLDKNGCSACRCKNGNSNCPSLAGCRVQCSRGYVIDDEGCVSCKCNQRKCRHLSTCKKQCPYGYKFNKKGCPRCKCENCPPLYSCAIRCANGMARNKYGCHVCRCRASDDHSVTMSLPSKSCFDPVHRGHHDDGETWSSGCYICMCVGGQVICDLLKCPLLDCDNPTFNEESCCAVCPEPFSLLSSIPQSLTCQQLGTDWTNEGEIWDLNQCTSCTCHSGQAMCTVRQCPPTACDNPIYDEQTCCPRCLTPTQIEKCHHKRTCHENGSDYESGSSFQRDPCTSCKCDDGVISCFTKTCSRTPRCEHPILKRGQCCSQCLDSLLPRLRSCKINNQLHAHGSEWTTTSGECMICVCIDGKILCEEQCCPKISSYCNQTITPPQSCCPECVVVNPPTLASGTPSAAAGPPTSMLVVVIIAVLALVITVVLIVFRKRLFWSHSTGKLEITKYTPKEKSNNYPSFEPQASQLLSVSTEEKQGRA